MLINNRKELEMPTITISVSESLKSELEKFKDRMNVSKICQEALEQKISCFRSIPEDKKQFEEIIIKLREGKMKYENEWEEAGFSDGVKEFSESSYEEIQDILTSVKNDPNFRIDINNIDEETISNLHEGFVEEYNKTSYDTFKNWLIGYVKGFAEMHDKIMIGL